MPRKKTIKEEKKRDGMSERDRLRRRAVDEILKETAETRDNGDAYSGHEFHAESHTGNVGGYGTGGAGYGGGFTQGDDNHGSDYGSRYGATGNGGRDHSGSLERGGAYGADETGGGGYEGSGRSYGSGVGREADFGYAPRSAGQYYTFGHDHDPRNLRQGGSGLDVPPTPSHAAPENAYEAVGIKSHHAKMRPTSHETPGDEPLKKQTIAMLRAAPDVDASDIHVEVANGDVTLLGHVSSRQAKYYVEELVQRIHEVAHVINLLRVSVEKHDSHHRHPS